MEGMEALLPSNGISDKPLTSHYANAVLAAIRDYSF